MEKGKSNHGLLDQFMSYLVNEVIASPLGTLVMFGLKVQNIIYTNYSLSYHCHNFNFNLLTKLHT